jgi:hypothetical protein
MGELENILTIVMLVYNESEVTSMIRRLGCRIYEVSIDYSGRTFAEGKKTNWKYTDGLVVP